MAEFLRLAKHYPEIRTLICIFGMGDEHIRVLGETWPWIRDFDVLDGSDSFFEAVRMKAAQAALAERPEDERETDADADMPSFYAFSDQMGGIERFGGDAREGLLLFI